MFGFQSTSASEVTSAADHLLSALADPEAARAFFKSVEDKVIEFTKIRDDAMASLREAEQKAAEADAALAESKRLAALLNADKVSLDKATADLQAREAAVTARENSLNDTAEKIKADFKSQQAKFDSYRSDFENAKAAGLQAVQDAKAAFDRTVEKTNADIAQQLSDAATLKAKAASDAAMAADLKAMWEGKVKAFNTLAQSLTTPAS
jgi:chromosome segregation ATPase